MNFYFAAYGVHYNTYFCRRFKAIFLTRIISILLLLGILLQSFAKLIIYANYELNKETITQLFCENKSKPKMHCNGKCHLMKQMKAQDKKENTPVNTLKDKFENQVPSSYYSFQHINESYTIVAHSYAYTQHESTSHLQAIFHPPTC